MLRRLRRAGLGAVLSGAALVAITHSGVSLPVQISGATAAPRGSDVSLEGRDPGGREDTAPVAARVSDPTEAERFVGDASLRDLVDLERATLEDGRYVIATDSGKQLVLTLDPDVQRAAEAALARAKAPRGAIVVTAVDGRILALAGHRGGDRGAAPALGRDLDVALSVWAPAASVFKVVTATALIAAGVKPDTKVCYHGGVRSVEASNLIDDRKRDQRCGTLTDGVSRSQNAIIAKLSHRHLKPRALKKMARAFGFGRAPELALPVEPSRAQIPSGSLDFARVAAGFWHTELSPLGGAVVANTVAAGGVQVTPYIVERVVDGDQSLAIEPVPARRVMAKRVARAVSQMMTATTETGTAYRGFHDHKRRSFLPTVAVAGKTGTLVRANPSFLEYSWFVGFAPSDKPEYSISVLLGNPPRWHLKAHTAARMVLQALF